MEAGTQEISRSLTGKEQRVASNGQRTRVINSGRRERVVRIEQPAGAAPTVQGEAVSIGPAVEADPVIWTARLRTGRVVTFLANVSRAFRAGALIASEAVEDSVVIAAAAAVDLVVALIASVVLADLAAAALAGSAAVVAGSGADAEN